MNASQSAAPIYIYMYAYYTIYPCQCIVDENDVVNGDCEYVINHAQHFFLGHFLPSVIPAASRAPMKVDPHVVPFFLHIINSPSE